MSAICNSFMGTVAASSFRISNMPTRTLMPGFSQLSVNLRELREEHRLTLRELAAVTGIPWGTLAGWENDRVKTINVDAIGQLARAYGLSTIDLMRRLGIPI